jgi:hypothetical protein
MPDNIWIGDCPAKGPSECAPEWSWAWDGLVGLWAPALGPTGNALFDLSGRNNHGTLTNMDPATDWVGSPGGWALDFDGSDGHIHCGNITNTSELTLIAVLDEYTNGDKFQYIASQRNDDFRNWHFYIRRSVQTGGFDRKLTICGGGFMELIGTTILEDATPYLVAATINRTVGSLYVNGVLDVTGAVDAITNHALPTLIGCRYSTGTVVNTPLNGSLSLVGISSRAWSAEEVRAWTADPLGLLRPAGFGAELWYSGGAPPAGSSIPAIYDYYRRLRCA